jgi:hypothetical protein
MRENAGNGYLLQLPEGLHLGRACYPGRGASAVKLPLHCSLKNEAHERLIVSHLAIRIDTMVRRQARERTVALLVVAVVAAVGVTVAAVVLTGNRTVRALLSRMLLLLVSALAHAIMPRLRLERACF